MQRPVFNLFGFVLLIGFLLLFVPLHSGTNAQTAPAPPSTGVQIQPVKYAELGQAIKSHRGKVVVVDIWALW
jgi:thiol:disulfide interchange protein